MTVRVLIADDHPVVRAGVAALLGTDPDIEIVATASTPSQALAAAASVDIDLVLLDLQFSSGTDALSGVDVTRTIRSQPNPPEVLILTNYDTDADILAAVEAGATGYLLKDAPAEELLSAIHQSARGEGALAPAVATRLMARMRSPQTSLTARELDVLEASAEGLSNAQIAQLLVVSEATVKTHLSHIYTKLGVTSRGAAVAKARDSGLIR
ncbi:response regulator transcription factor [Cutibacterium sp. WCA-380-WT-3A]|uniref:Response regulator transcription factor n=1 Tax=Cutibacterium porci TaxID=2605781 RepID=A0A7K0J6J4_9ACTN|nr:response regulator transcription factor [Cutibacterium porci]MSS45580.1 response regulator transcription factor [Cutibacterium porci]